MTAKEMAHWEGWLRKGQRRFQLTYTLAFFAMLGLGPALAGLVWDRPAAWGLERLLVSALVSLGLWFIFGSVWKSKVAEYQRQSAVSPTGRT